MANVILPDNLPALNAAIFRRAQQDVPQLEDPPYSNRSPYLDALCHEFGVPLGSYWCALQASKVWKDAGAAIPPVDTAKGWHPAKAQSWYEWSLFTGRFNHEPVIGAAVLYGESGRAPAHHIGACVASTHPFLYDFEGNTADAAFSRNGELYTLKRIDTDRLIGYVHPLPWSGGRL